MKKAHWLVKSMIIATLLLSFGCGNSKVELPQEIVDDPLGIILHLPADWTSQQNGLVRVMTGPDPSIFVQVVVIPSPINTGKEKFALDQFNKKEKEKFLEGMEADLLGRQGDVKLEESGFLKLKDGKTAVFLHYYIPSGAEFYSLTILRDREVVVFAAGADSRTKYDENEDVLEAIAESFQVK